MPAALTSPHPDVYLIPEFVSVDECNDLIAVAQAHGFEAADVRTREGSRAMPMIRNNQRAMFKSPEWVALLWQRLALYDLPQVDGQHAVCLPEHLRFYRYDPGQRFKMHKDGPWTEHDRYSQLTMLVYLNDGFVGGQTKFKEYEYTPRTGDCLLFVHQLWHEGAAVIEGAKYVLRSDVMYEPN
jgi:predicted 2-oxoglutarate/Fe(II)-dependent dioxygenase YbiX